MGGTTSSGTGAPTITAVHISQIGQNIHIEVDGMGFGAAPSALPGVGNLAQFGITDTTQGSWCAGHSGCPVNLQYTSWTNTSVVVDGFGPQYGAAYRMLPGDMVSILVGAPASSGGGTTTWTGTIQNEHPAPPDPGGPTPRVESVTFGVVGPNMHVEVNGSGFGLAPGVLPAVANLNQFGITDLSQGSWCAGRSGCAVNLQYTSWTDTTIVIDGFGPQYPNYGKVADNDQVSIFIQNSSGPEFWVWTGPIHAGAAPPPDPLGPTPRIASVAFSQIGPNLHVELDGSGFGAAPGVLPAVTNLGQFGLTDLSQGSWCAGRSGCAVNLQYTSWTDSTIVIDGFGPQYPNYGKVVAGDAVSIFLQNSHGPEFTVWTGTLQAGTPPAPDPLGPTPRVATVTFSQIGQNLHIEVDGSGFGTAPGVLPAVANLNQFGITDVAQGGWCAGRIGCPVSLHYTSWTDSTIVVDGFGPQYGGTYKVVAGDAVSIFVQNSPGPEFQIWTGTLQ
jgi:hypothetical protein